MTYKIKNKKIKIISQSVSDDKRWICKHYSDGGIRIEKIKAKKIK